MRYYRCQCGDVEVHSDRAGYEPSIVCSQCHEPARAQPLPKLSVEADAATADVLVLMGVSREARTRPGEPLTIHASLGGKS
jgi:hypothetical protein